MGWKVKVSSMGVFRMFKRRNPLERRLLSRVNYYLFCSSWEIAAAFVYGPNLVGIPMFTFNTPYTRGRNFDAWSKTSTDIKFGIWLSTCWLLTSLAYGFLFNFPPSRKESVDVQSKGFGKSYIILALSSLHLVILIQSVRSCRGTHSVFFRPIE